MKISTIMRNNKNIKHKKALHYGLSVLFWLVVWQVISMVINKPIVLVSPVMVVEKLAQFAVDGDFWCKVGFSFLRIEGGFLLALLCGCIFAVISNAVPFIRVLLSPLVSAVKATPVASIVILALLWIPSRNLSMLIAFLMVFPVIYSNIFNGIRNVDKDLLDMAKVFKVSAFKKFLYIYLPDVMPFFVSACSVSLGLCWKSGIAAEVIAQPKGSVGDGLYRAKIYLETADLFAWTVVIIVISAVFEKLFLLFLKWISKRIEKGGMSVK